MTYTVLEYGFVTKKLYIKTKNDFSTLILFVEKTLRGADFFSLDSFINRG